MIDEIEVALDESAAIVLRHYDCHIGEIAKEKGLSQQEARHVGSCVLQALRVMHAVGHIHTGLSTPSTQDAQ
jgi:casein kinase II subunit alpha